MDALGLETAQKIVEASLSFARTKGFKPLAVVILDARGSLKVAAAEDGTSLGRPQIAFGKAYGALMFECNSRTLGAMAVDRPHFVNALNGVFGGNLIPVPGGVTIRNIQQSVIGALGISGDTSDNDEAAALAGLVAANLFAAEQ